MRKPVLTYSTIEQDEIECGAQCCIVGAVLAHTRRRLLHVLLSLSNIHNRATMIRELVAMTYEMEEWNLLKWFSRMLD